MDWPSVLWNLTHPLLPSIAVALHAWATRRRGHQHAESLQHMRRDLTTRLNGIDARLVQVEKIVRSNGTTT